MRGEKVKKQPILYTNYANYLQIQALSKFKTTRTA